MSRTQAHRHILALSTSRPLEIHPLPLPLGSDPIPDPIYRLQPPVPGPDLSLLSTHPTSSPLGRLKEKRGWDWRMNSLPVSDPDGITTRKSNTVFFFFFLTTVIDLVERDKRRPPTPPTHTPPPIPTPWVRGHPQPRL